MKAVFLQRLSRIEQQAKTIRPPTPEEEEKAYCAYLKTLSDDELKRLIQNKYQGLVNQRAALAVSGKGTAEELAELDEWIDFMAIDDRKILKVRLKEMRAKYFENTTQQNQAN